MLTVVTWKNNGKARGENLPLKHCMSRVERGNALKCTVVLQCVLELGYDITKETRRQKV